jgi:hypothetical protein
MRRRIDASMDTEVSISKRSRDADTNQETEGGVSPVELSCSAAHCYLPCQWWARFRQVRRIR